MISEILHFIQNDKKQLFTISSSKIISIVGDDNSLEMYRGNYEEDCFGFGFRNPTARIYSVFALFNN